MTKMIQVRNVPEDLHTRLKVRAARAGMSLSAYLLREIELVADRPTLSEWVADVQESELVTMDGSPAEAIRRDRDDREAQLAR